MILGLESANEQWAGIDYDHLKKVYIRTGRQSDMTRALVAWQTLARAQDRVQALPWRGTDATSRDQR